MSNNNLELCVADVNNIGIYAFSSTMEEAKEKLTKAIAQNNEDIKIWEGHTKKYPNREDLKNYLTEAQNKNYKIMTYDEYLQIEKEHYLNKPITEITEENFNDMLNVLPPIKWCTKNNIEMFCMSEMLTGTYTSQYLHDRNKNKFYHKIVDILDINSWGYNFI